MTSAHNTQKGFTLIEILIAVAIVALAAVTVGPTLFNLLSGQKHKIVKNQMRQINTAIQTFYADTNQFPQMLNDLVRQPADPDIAKNWHKGSYLGGDSVPKDPWGNKYKYELTPGGAHPYELFSRGANGKQAPRAEWISVWKL